MTDPLAPLRDLPRLKLAMKQPVVVDLRNVYRPEEMIQARFTYESVGRGTRGSGLGA